MEYLMTYGWAILVIVIVLAALLYLGVFNLGERVPDQCRFKVGILCTSAKVSAADGMTVKLQNTLGSTIYVCQLRCSGAQDDTGLLVETAYPIASCGTPLATIASGQAASVPEPSESAKGCLTDGTKAASDTPDTLYDTAGERVRGKAYMWYYEQGDTGSNARVAVGDLQTTIQP